VSELTPQAADDLDVHEVADGLVVYDLASDRVHYLNETASLVFALCTGEHDESRIAQLVGRAWRLPQPPEAEVAACLSQLRSEGLIR